MMSHIQQMKKNLHQMLKMKNSLMKKDEATSTSHIIPQKTYLLIYLLVFELDHLFKIYVHFLPLCHSLNQRIIQTH